MAVSTGDQGGGSVTNINDWRTIATGDNQHVPQISLESGQWYRLRIVAPVNIPQSIVGQQTSYLLYEALTRLGLRNVITSINLQTLEITFRT